LQEAGTIYDIRITPSGVFCVHNTGRTVFGQTLCEITGRVSDSSSAGVPAATITLTNISTNTVRVTTSTDSGDYALPSVPPGFYNVKTAHTGFKTATSSNIEVQVQQTVRLDIVLQVGQVSESVEVSTQADLLQAENASVGTVIENKGVTELPLNGRNYLGLVALAANVNTLAPAAGQAGSRQGGDRANQSISAGGQRIMFDYFTLEGPGIFNIDFEVHKQFRMPYKEDHILQFRLETFNVLNHPNWGMPGLNILSGSAFPGQPGTNAHQNFGVVSSTQVGMRQVQLGLKYSF
jgi:hypothetical protein